MLLPFCMSDLVDDLIFEPKVTWNEREYLPIGLTLKSDWPIKNILSTLKFFEIAAPKSSDLECPIKPQKTDLKGEAGSNCRTTHLIICYFEQSEPADGLFSALQVSISVIRHPTPTVKVKF